MAKKTQQLSPGLLQAREQLGQYLTVDKDDQVPVTMEDKLAVIDRLIKIEALEFKINGNRGGSAFDDDEEE